MAFASVNPYSIRTLWTCVINLIQYIMDVMIMVKTWDLWQIITISKIQGGHYVLFHSNLIITFVIIVVHSRYLIFIFTISVGHRPKSDFLCSRCWLQHSGVSSKEFSAEDRNVSFLKILSRNTIRFVYYSHSERPDAGSYRIIRP